MSCKSISLRGAKFLAVASLASLALAGCKHLEDPGTRVAGWALVDASQRHPILVSQKPKTLTLHVARGSDGLTPHQRAQLLGFYDHYRATDAGNTRIIISAPSGSSNEISAMNAVRDARYLLAKEGVADSDMIVEAYHSGSGTNPPIKVSYLRYVAEGPECGDFSTNLASEPTNLPYPNFGCTTQRNFAAQIANPADLIMPRNMTPRSSERRDAAYNKYVKGDTTGAKKSDEEKIQVQKK